MAQTNLTVGIILSPLVKVAFKEAINWKVLISMLWRNDILRTVCKKDAHGKELWFENERKQMIQILKLGCKYPLYRKKMDKASQDTEEFNKILQFLYHHTEQYMRPSIPVKYFYNKNKKIGRIYPEKSLSLCNIRRGIRHHLCNGLYLDIDMVNAHFKIADELFNKESIQFPVLHDYVINRNRYLDSLGKHFVVEGFHDGLDFRKPDDYDSLKTCFIRILYFGDYMSWVKEMGLPPLDPPQFLVDLKSEFDKMADLIIEKNPHFEEHIVFEKKDNVKGTIISWFLQEHERRLLETMFDFLHRSKQIKNKDCVLCFDGIMILLNDKTRDPAVVSKLLRDCEAYLLKHTGFNICLKDKPFDNLPYTEKIEEVDIPFVDDPVILIDDKDDNEASNIIYELIKDDLIFCNSQFYVKSDNVWTNDIHNVDSTLLNFVLNSGIKTVTAKGDVKCYAQYTVNAKHIVECVKSIASRNPQNELYDRFHSSTRGKLCFNDGVLFIKEQKFVEWGSPDVEDICSTLIIRRDFKPYFDALGTGQEFDLSKEIQDIEKSLFTDILDNQADKMLHFLSRAMAGFFEDKDWGLWIGSRNCGKGCINTLLLNSFSEYVTSIASACLMCSRVTSTDTKEKSWMIDLQYPRLAIMQEVDKKEGQKMNGTSVKSICSGGDTQVARKNFQDEILFIIACKLLIMCNDMVQCDPVDTFETCIQFNSGKQFKSKEFIDATREELQTKADQETSEEKKHFIMSKMNTYLVADDTMKDKCKTVRWGNAFVLLLMQKFVDKKLEPTNDSDLVEDDTNVDSNIEKHIIVTQNKNDTLTNQELKEINAEMATGLSFQKFKNILISRGCEEYKVKSIRGLRYIKRVDEGVGMQIVY
jgi:hypothetical protein